MEDFLNRKQLTYPLMLEYIIYQSLGSSNVHGMSRILSTYVQILANLDGNVSTSSSQVHP